MITKYQEFERLKKEIALKLLSIQDGDCMSDLPDDMMATGTNHDVVNECAESMNKLSELANELAKHEELV
ncbi:hypothetical protein [Enterococcus sp. AZ163]|uniref:hypothetical protein n=1 Tax=Enterococcus sp. AZ163 TaxID=2774638 RepID=UPI003D2DAA84